MSYILCLMSYVLCLMYYILCLMSYFLCLMSYVLCLMSYALCLMSYVLCLISYVLCLMSYVGPACIIVLLDASCLMRVNLSCIQDTADTRFMQPWVCVPLIPSMPLQAEYLVWLQNYFSPVMLDPWCL